MFGNELIQIELNKILNQNFGSQFLYIEKGITTKSFLVGDLDIPYRWITHWDQKDLLFTKEETSKWRRYDFVDFVWIKMIQKLRSFNVSIAQIKLIKDQLIQEITFEEAINTEEVRQAVKALNPTINEGGIDSILDDALKNGSAKKEKLNFLKLFLLDAIVLKNHFALLLNEKMELVIYKENFRSDYLDNIAFKEFLLSSHLTLSLTELIVEFISMNDLEFIQNDLKLITESEKEVLSYLRTNENVSAINIKYKNGSMNALEIVENRTVDLSQRLTDIMMTKGYEEIIIKTQKGTIVHCENTRKIKLKGTK